MIELQADSLQLFLNLRSAIPQILLVGVYQNEIVHIAEIVFYSEPLFYVMVEIVEHRERHELRYLRAEPYSYFSERVHNLARPRRYLFILYPLADSGFRYIVPYAREIVLNITLEYPTV